MQSSNKCIMIQSTTSSAGKSIFVTALCRILTQDGYNVSPFKACSTSAKSYITADGLEFAFSQAIQANACGKMPQSNMNPVYLKPKDDTTAQLLFNGKLIETVNIEDDVLTGSLKDSIISIFKDLQNKNDIVLIEGSGNPTDYDAPKNKFANMGIANIAQSPVLLVSSTEFGGSIASITGTWNLLSDDQKQLVKGYVLTKNKKHVNSLSTSKAKISELTGLECLGIIPYFDFDEISTVSYKKGQSSEKLDLDIAIINLPNIIGVDDYDALLLEPNVNVRFVNIDEPLLEPNIIILPNVKNILKALKKLRRSGMDQKIVKAYNNGSFIFGICGGFKILSDKIYDCISGDKKNLYFGLKLLDVTCDLHKVSPTTIAFGVEKLFGEKIKGHEITSGAISLSDSAIPFLVKKDGSFDGCMSQNKKIIGTSFHGIFHRGSFRRNYLNYVRRNFGKELYIGEIINYREYKSKKYDALASIVRNSVDIDRIYEIIDKK